jgi:hypothetical protein
MHAHAERGYDQRSDNAWGQWMSSLQAHRVRQQAGFYRAVFSEWEWGWCGASRDAYPRRAWVRSAIGLCTGSVDILVASPPRSPASRLLQCCVQPVDAPVTPSVTGRIPTQSVGTISDQITHGVNGCPRCKPTAFASKPAPTGLCSASGTGFSREAFDLHLIRTLSAFDLHTQKAQTPPNATWVQAERRRCAVGRAAWMRRERRQDMDVRSARAHGASSE